MSKRPAGPLISFLFAAALLTGAAPALAANGFDLSDALVPRTLIEHGGPPRDGIPAIDFPRFVPAAEVDFLGPEDRVLGLTAFGETRAYPSARAFRSDGVQLPAVTAYWFAWYAYHPDTAVFESDPTE